jgi:uroporphyrin-3 C-methyltransferase
MSPEHNNTPSPPAPSPAVASVSEPVRRSVPWLAWLALAAAALALVFSGLIWQKLGFTQQELARRTQDSTTQAIEARALAGQSNDQTKELQARLAVAELRLSEVTLQRSQLEELMLTLSRSRDDNLVQDIESSLRLAQQQAQLTGSAQPLVSALQSADQRIARAAQPRLNPLQRAIARDIQRIQGSTLTDVPALVAQLDELARRVDQWPVPSDVKPVVVPKRASDATPPSRKAAAPAPDQLPAQAEAAATDWTSVQGWSALSGRVWADITRSGRELVRVSRIDRPDAALLAPEQAFFLRENTKLKLLNARLGLLARQMDAVQADLKAVDMALARHFDATAPAVIAAQASLVQLRAELASVALPRPDESLAALAAAAGGR